MTNTALLQQKIKERGLKNGFLAEALGLSRSGFWRKVNGRALFNQYEIQTLCKLLSIETPQEKEEIFFAQNVGIFAYD